MSETNIRTKIKICGLFRECDAKAVNEALPDYAGLVFYEKSRRYVTFEQAQTLRAAMHPAIATVGVFVNAPIDEIAALYQTGAIAVVQLHGSEDANYLAALRQRLPGVEIWQAFAIRVKADLNTAAASAADRVLLDNGGGTGVRFDWSLPVGFLRPFVLAGGLTPENIPEAISRLCPSTLDLSSGVETNGLKDRQKILAAVTAARTGQTLADDR